MDVQLTAAELADIVCPHAEEWPAAERTCAALRASPLECLEGKDVATAHLRRIYRVRLSRPGAVAAVVGSDRLLSDLESYDGESALMVVFQRGDQLFCVLLDQTARRLVSCTVGRDRRMPVP